MEVSRRQDRRRMVAAAALGALALLPASLPASSASGAALGTGCAHAGAHPGDATLKEMERAIVCLINEKRGNRGKPRLDSNRKLGGAAADHSKTMVVLNCFEHKCPGEPGFERRVRQSGYPDGADRWKARENLGCASTPRRMIRAFMRTDASRRNLLNANFRDIGVGARAGSPTTPGDDRCQPDADFVTYTVILAWRRG